MSERALSLDEAVARAERRYKARAVRAEEKRHGDRIEYRIRLLAEEIGPDEAELAYRRALELQENLLSAHLNLAALYVADGAMDSALERLDAAHRLAPGHPGVDRLRALALQPRSVP